MADAIGLADLRPFLAPVLLEPAGGLEGRPLLDALVAEAAAEAGKAGTRERRLIRTTGAEEDGDLVLRALIYREAGAPSWLARAALKDVEHHLLVVAVRGRQAALIASDGAMRDRIVKNSKAARRVPRHAITAFVGAEARAIWLSGVHTPTASKPDSKMLTGTSLEYALDPIGDQSYYYSAVRSAPDVADLTTPFGRRPQVGASPAGSRIWIRRAKDLDDLKKLLRAVFDHAAGAAAGPDPFDMLSQEVDEVAEVSDAYGIAIVPPELLSEDEVGPELREQARRWAYDARFDVAPLDGLDLRVSPSIGDVRLGVLDLALDMAGGAARIAADWVSREPGLEAEQAECLALLSDPDRIRIHYDSGHTIAQGRCYAGGYRDLPFGWEFRSFDGFDVTKEKPKVPVGSTLAAQIGEAGDDSLFAYVCRAMFCDEEGQPKGWLASDDGSMELADFIHIDPEAKIVSLVHVKGSGRGDIGRRASASDYEVVVGQAVKNLRHLDRRNLADELERGKGKKIGAAVWQDGARQPDRTGLLKVAKGLPASATKRLIVLQPRVTRSEWSRCRSDGAPPADAMRIRQIDTLLLAARASALACGASFLAIGDLAGDDAD